MQAYELIRIAGFYTDISKKYSGGPLSIQLRQLKYYWHNASHYTTVNTKNIWYINAPVHIVLYILRQRDVFLNYFYFFAYQFFGKNCAPPPLFVTELHNYGCADITSLNEMLTCSWDKHTHVFSSQLAPSIRFYTLWNKKK